MGNRPGGTVQPSKSPSRWFLPSILGLLLLARLGFAMLVYARPELALANDSDRYVPIANAILSGTAYAWNTEHPGELLNTVGYPLFLAAVYAVLGHEPGDVALGQLFLTGAMIFVMYAVLSRSLGDRAAFPAAMLLALDPLTILWSMTVLTEALFAVMLGIGAVLLASWTRSEKRLVLILAGLFTGLACLVKPLAMLIVGIWGVALFLFSGSRPERKSGLLIGIQRSLLFVLPSVLLITPWFVRNALLWDCPALSSVDRVTMRDYMAAKVLAEAEHADLNAVQEQLQQADPGVCPSKTRTYLGIMLANPATYARLHIAGTVPVLIGTNFDRWLQYLGMDYTLPDLWRPYMDGGWRGLGSVIEGQVRQYPQAIAVMLGLTAFQLLLYWLATLGAAVAIGQQHDASRWVGLVLVMAILVLVLTPGQGGHERFRVPVQPLLAILIAYWAGRGGRRHAEKTESSTAVVAA